MPEISCFFGLIIAMYFNDHALPYFHVRYGGQQAVIGIENLALIERKLSPRVFGMVIEWATIHQDELRENWRRVEQKESLQAIEPLE